MQVPATKIHPGVDNHRSPFCICILNLDMGLEEAEVPGCQPFMKIVREQVNADFCSDSERLKIRGRNRK